MPSKIVTFTLNGREVEAAVKPLTTLQALLRHQLGETDEVTTIPGIQGAQHFANSVRIVAAIGADFLGGAGFSADGIAFRGGGFAGGVGGVATVAQQDRRTGGVLRRSDPGIEAGAGGGGKGSRSMSKKTLRVMFPVEELVEYM